MADGPGNLESNWLVWDVFLGSSGILGCFAGSLGSFGCLSCLSSYGQFSCFGHLCL